MLAPRASNAFVCLRCELTLARPRLSLLSRRPPHAAFSSSTRRHDALDEAFPPDQARPRLSEHPLGRVRRRKGRAIRETTARLDGTTALGEDASIIVLEELGGDRKTENPDENAAQTDLSREQPLLNLAEAIGDEAPATLDEVVHQLDKLRRKATKTDATLDEGHFVSHAVFVNLSNLLSRGFTGVQLSHYYSVKKNVKKDRVATQVMEGLRELQRKSKRPAERSEWTPGITPINRRLPTLAVHPSHKPHKRRSIPIGKHLLVDQILRDVWRLETLEELEAAGEIELMLEDWQLALLTAGAHETALDRVGKARIAKLEISAVDKVLRITADKHAAEYAADDVEELLQSTEARGFQLTSWLPSLDTVSGAEPSLDTVFPDHVLREVAALTGAYLQRDTDQIIIRGLDKDAVAEAERCLLKMMPFRAMDTTVDRSGVPSDQSHFVPVALEKETVDYKLREAKLGRWSLPIGESGSQPLQSDAIAKRMQSTQAHITEMASALVDKTDSPDEPSELPEYSLWNEESEPRLEAKFGHLLHPLDDPTARQPYFAPTLPGVSSVLREGSFKPSYTTRSSLTYEFISQPGSKDTESTQFEYPRLFVTIRPDRFGQHNLNKIALIFGDTRHSVLLPEEVVDVSFRFNQTLLLKERSGVEGFSLWQKEILQNLRSGGRLNAPKLELPIPKWTVRGMEFATKDEMTHTKYLFTGVRIHQTMWGVYEDIVVSYATSQSGKIGAKTRSLKLPYAATASSKKMSIKNGEDSLKKFVANAYKMAGEITKAAAASGTTMTKIERPPRDTTARIVTKKQNTSAAPTSASEDAVSQLLAMQEAQKNLSQPRDEAVSSNGDEDVAEIQQSTEKSTETAAVSGDESFLDHTESQILAENEEPPKEEGKSLPTSSA